MKSLNEKLGLLVEHLDALNETFLKKSNYTDPEDHKVFKRNYDAFEKLSKNDTVKNATLRATKGGVETKVGVSFADEIYHQSDRQMKIADIIEYLFFSRGIYYIFQSDRFEKERIRVFLELILRYVNLLMVFENTTVDSKLRNKLLKALNKLVKNDVGLKELKSWSGPVGLPSQKSGAPSLYFDSLLPKTAGGLWHEMLVFAFILKYDIGYIFPLLLTQKPISLTNKLSPPDLIILHKATYRYYGIEIGTLKERQSGGFMAPSGIPVIPIDTINARISDRCPICGKWIEICEFVVDDFCNIENQQLLRNEVRCLVECKKYSLNDKLNGKCPSMKYKYGGTIDKKSFSFSNGHHYHYKCCLKKENSLSQSIKNISSYDTLIEIDKLNKKESLTDDEREWFDENYSKVRKKFNFLKTHSVYYSEMSSLIKMNKHIQE